MATAMERRSVGVIVLAGASVAGSGPEEAGEEDTQARSG